MRGGGGGGRRSLGWMWGIRKRVCELDAEKRRTAFLVSEGIHVMRFWDHDVLRDTEVVREMIYRICDERKSLVIPPHPNPLPKGEGVNTQFS